MTKPIGFEVLIVMTVKSTIYWDVTLCSLIELSPDSVTPDKT
jgi:hypothetical protein